MKRSFRPVRTGVRPGVSRIHRRPVLRVVAGGRPRPVTDDLSSLILYGQA